MRMYAFSLLPGGQTRITSASFLTWKLAENHSRASRNRGSRRSSYRRNIKFTCSFVTSPMFPPLDWIGLDWIGLDCRLIFCGSRQTDFRPRSARKSTALEHPASADRPKAARDDDSYDS